jgi:hypothetical protein
LVDSAIGLVDALFAADDGSVLVLCSGGGSVMAGSVGAMAGISGAWKRERGGDCHSGGHLYNNNKINKRKKEIGK